MNQGKLEMVKQEQPLGVKKKKKEKKKIPNMEFIT